MLRTENSCHSSGKLGAAILDDEHLEAAIHRRAHDALDREIGRHAADQQRIAAQHAQHRIELRAVRAVDGDAAGEDEILRRRRHRGVRLGTPRALDQRRLRGGAPVQQRVGARKVGLARVVDVRRPARRPRAPRRSAPAPWQHAALLHLRRQHAAKPLLADVVLVHDVVLQLDQQQRGRSTGSSSSAMPACHR